ncbi:MAG TPA: rhodanese-like domain-containing protein [Acidimicrobiales bacterium]|nr:rhodanese-like domain-containing protein [Acidimicrobiales bacterium]
MFFKQFYLQGLGHASYVVGSEQTGEALVFDPQRHVDGYFAEARTQGLRIRYALDSHGHNDYLSGLSEVAQRADVQVLGSAEADLGYPHRPLQDGEHLEMGEVGIEVLHTPGHTPEHISLLVYDRSASADDPALLLSGGALLVGDLARPDLLGGSEQAEESAKVFCHTIQKKLLELPDHVEVFPTHVAGSLCGGNIGSRLSTTVGYERLTNAILANVSSKGEFVEQCLRLDNLPAVPPYWRRMRRQNMDGVAGLGVLPEPPALKPQAVKSALRDGAVVLDTRSPEAFGGGHVPGALNVGQGAAFATWAGTVLEEGARVVLVLDAPADLWSVTWDLLRIGYDPPVGWLAGGMMAWRTAALDIERLPQITVHELRRRLEAGELNVLDVRQPAEWASGHVRGATFITGGALPDRMEEVPDDKPLAVTCGSGYRSSVSSSLLARNRKLDLVNVLGGMSAWKAAGYPITKED